MSDQRRGLRLRNSRRIKNILKMKPVVITLLAIICLLVALLVYKTYEKNKQVSLEQAKRAEEIYLLFEEIDTVSKNLNSGINEEGTPKTVKEDVTAKIVTVGDILCERPIYEDAYEASTKKYDFSHMFSNIQKHTLDSDVTLRVIRNQFCYRRKSFRTRSIQ